ncbi:hypothetical protein ILUMI_19507 [Ignelater luminosus]|uniref:Uncharacterized protein n=1 Tax=Ignelater luminosus TaxID=2038154 RepID=A0A8K0G5I7_IGNLU|nr:hypothetical protein ILUMI_19507 [Ignelater luminosus]
MAAFVVVEAVQFPNMKGDMSQYVANLEVIFASFHLAAGVWTFEGHYVLYYVTLAMSELITAFSGHFCCFFDCMYAAFCAEIIVQFKILCYHIEHLAADDGNLQERELNFSNKMKKYVD